MRWSLAVNASSLTVPLKPLLATVSQWPIDGLQFDARRQLRPQDLSATGRREFLHRLSEREMKVAALDFPTRGTLFDLDRLDDRVAALRGVMQFAYELKAPLVTVRAGRYPVDDETAAQRARDVLAELSRFADHVGVTVCCHVLGDQMAAWRELLQDLDIATIRIYFDPATAVFVGQRPAKLLRDVQPVLGAVRGRDGLREADGAGVEAPLGRGEVDWDEVFATLAEMPYEGWVILDRTTGTDVAADLANAIQFARQYRLETLGE